MTLNRFKNKESEAAKTEQLVFYPMMVKVMADEETKQYHLKRLYELSLKSIASHENKIGDHKWT